METLRRWSRLRAVWDGVRTSLWFVPSVMLAGGAALALAATWLDLEVLGGDGQSAPWWVFVSSADTARGVVSTFLASIITMMSLVFSITMVVLTLAASQFGPRLIRNFMASTQTQIVLGTFAMTTVYCLLTLSAVGLRASEGERPFFGVSVAIALMGWSVVLLILFIHTLARSIVSETVIERVGSEVDTALGHLEPLGPESRDEDPEDALPPDFQRTAVRFGPARAGYIQAIEFDPLINIARESDTVIGLYARAGDYVERDGFSVAVYPPEKDSPELREKVLRAIGVGVHRTPVQDIDYSIRHMVEIAVRALSPGINDPYTAVSVVHRLSASLSQLMALSLPSGVHRDEDGAVRVVCPQPRYATVVSACFDQIRQSGAEKPMVVIHLVEALSRIAQHATWPSQLQALRDQINVLAEDARSSIANGSDHEAIKTRIEKALYFVDQRMQDAARA